MKCSKCHEEIPMYEDDMIYHANDYGNVCKECYDSIFGCDNTVDEAWQKEVRKRLSGLKKEMR